MTAGEAEVVGLAGLFLGVDVGGTKLRMALADGRGRILREDAEPTITAPAAGLAGQIRTMLERLVDELDARGRPVLAAGIALPVAIDDRGGTVDSWQNVPGLAEPDALGAIRAALAGIAVGFDNDANLAAVAERAQGAAAGIDDLVVMAIGTGIGMGIVAGGRIVHGDRGMAGEVAYLPLGTDPQGPAAHERGAFEAAVAGPAIRARLAAALATGRESSLSAGATFAEILAAADGGNALARDLVAEEARLVALGIAAVNAVVAPALVVLGGGVGAQPGLLDPVRRNVAELVRRPPRVVTSRLGDRGPLVGALILARSLVAP